MRSLTRMVAVLIAFTFLAGHSAQAQDKPPDPEQARRLVGALHARERLAKEQQVREQQMKVARALADNRRAYEDAFGAWN